MLDGPATASVRMRFAWPMSKSFAPSWSVVEFPMLKTPSASIDCIVRVVTPENIEFEYMLAGPFQRLPAFVLDVGFRWLFFLFFCFASQFLGAVLFSNLTEWLTTILALLLYFVIGWFYGIVLETVCSGQTIGKMLFRLRVISVDGRPINASQAAIRNLLRSADMAPLLSIQIFSVEAPAAYLIPTMFLGLVSTVVTARMQRIGDLAARTMVIVDRGGRAAAVYQPDDSRAFALAELIPPTFQVTRSLSKAIGMYMETRKRFSPARRSELASLLAIPLIRHMGLSPETSPDLLLCAVYVRTFLSEEHRAQANMQRTQAMRRMPTQPLSQNAPTANTTLSSSGSGTAMQDEPVVVPQPTNVLSSADVVR